MKRFFGFGLIVCLLAACFDEQRVDPARPATFVRYINGGFPDSARALEKTPDGGYVILANTFPSENTPRIKVVKADQYGTVLWTKIIPDVAEAGVISYRANAVSAFSEGYIITGETIKSEGATTKASLLIIEIDANGGTPKQHTIDLSKVQEGNGSARGLAVQRINDSRLLVLGSLTGMTTGPNIGKNIVVTELNLSNPTQMVTWEQIYGSNSVALINRLFIDSTKRNPTDSVGLIFGGTVLQPGDNNLSDIRVLRTLLDGASTGVAEIGEPGLTEAANGMCRTLNGYAVIGSTNNDGEGNLKSDRDILFTKLDVNGTVLLSKTYPVTYPGGSDVGLDDEGNAISSTKDQGFIMLGTILTAAVPGTDDVIGRGATDYYLMKIDNFGAPQWQTSFGSKREDTGVSVVQAEDGGYVILGTTDLANVATLALIKTNSAGEIK
jgi:hypothetical protein